MSLVNTNRGTRIIVEQAEEIERLQVRVAELEDKLRHSDRKEIEACYRAMGKKDARIAALENALRLIANPGDITTAEELGYIAKELIENESQ